MLKKTLAFLKKIKSKFLRRLKLSEQISTESEPLVGLEDHSDKTLGDSGSLAFSETQGRGGGGIARSEEVKTAKCLQERTQTHPF